MSKVVIIGSGLGGLSCGYILQKNGYDVTILEQGNQTGGCLQCFYRQGAKFETGMHYIGSADKGQNMAMVMHYLGLEDDVRLSRLDTDAYNTISLAGDLFRFPNGREAFVERMSSYFPAEKDALAEYVRIIDRIASESSIRSMANDRGIFFSDSPYQSMALDEVMDSLFKDPVLKNVLVGDLPLYAASPGRTPFSLHALIMDFYNLSAFRVAGGSDSIAGSLTRSVENAGGRVHTGSKVVRITCDDTKATGVITENGVHYQADYVISAVHPKRMLEMLDTKLIRPAFRTRINSIPETPGVFVVYVKFKEGAMPYMNTNFFCYPGGTPWNSERYAESEWPNAFLYMHMCHEEHPVWAKSGVVMAFMDMNDVQRWKGLPIGRRGDDYEEFKRLHAERLIALVERNCPGFAASIDNFFTSTPLTYMDYTGTEDGSMYGMAKDISLGQAGRVPYRTRIPNLFLAGQNVNSHGLAGVMVGTLLVCGELVPGEKLYRELFI